MYFTLILQGRVLIHTGEATLTFSAFILHHLQACIQQSANRNTVPALPPCSMDVNAMLC